MTILQFPNILPDRHEFGLESNTQTFASPLNKATQTVELPGAMWTATLSVTNRPRAIMAALEVFLVRLRGQAGRFYLHDHGHPTPFGVATGSPIVNGAGQTGASLLTTGWTPSVTGILKARDYFQVGNKMRMLVEDAGSDESGNATLVFDRPLVVSPTNNAALVVAKPCAVMMLAKGGVSWSSVRGIKKSATISCFEDVLA
jgi:hypothetical protein